MSRPGPALLVALLAGGCSSLSPNDAGVSNLQIFPPVCNGVEVGSSLDLIARTLDEHGDSVEAPVRWRTPDTVITVESETGRVTGVTISDTARVQALVGTKDPIISDLIPLVVTPKADTVALSSAARVRVDTKANGSPALLVTVSAKAAGTPVKSFQVIYRLIDPVFPAPAARTVEFAGGALTVTTCSAPTGVAGAGVTLNRRANQTQPDSAIVEVIAQHADGSALPGSGQRFTIVFPKP